MGSTNVCCAVDRLLLEQGVYAPLELLLAEGRLSFFDYEAWRCGGIATLEKLLTGNPEPIRALLEQAGRYAAALGLRAERREHLSWEEGAGQQLHISSDAVLADLCCIHYLRNANEVQLDLFAMRRALDWAGVRQAVLGERTWRDYPLVRQRLAEALFHLGKRREALAQWCLLCWDFPLDAENALADGKLPDKDLHLAWERYRDLDVEPELDAPFFPAWLLLERPEIRDALTAADGPKSHAASRAYIALHGLLADNVTLSEQTMTLRLQLRQAHPGLFTIYLRTL